MLGAAAPVERACLSLIDGGCVGAGGVVLRRDLGAGLLDPGGDAGGLAAAAASGRPASAWAGPGTGAVEQDKLEPASADQFAEMGQGGRRYRTAEAAERHHLLAGGHDEWRGLVPGLHSEQDLGAVAVRFQVVVKTAFCAG